MPHIPKAICADDKIEMVISATGVLVEMVASWGPYYKIYGDQYKCPKCQRAVFLPGEGPVSEHFKPDYVNWHASYQAEFVD